MMSKRQDYHTTKMKSYNYQSLMAQEKSYSTNTSSRHIGHCGNKQKQFTTSPQKWFKTNHQFLNIEISKKEQSSYWGGEINENQLKYASNDVLYLHRIKDRLNMILENENRTELVKECFKFLQTRVKLDLEGWGDIDIFSHQ